MKINVIRTIMNVLPEKQKEVFQTLRSLIEPPGKERGCLFYSIFCDIENKNIFNLISEWDSRQNLNHHIRSDRFGVVLGTKSLLSESMKIHIYTVSDFEGVHMVNSKRGKKI